MFEGREHVQGLGGLPVTPSSQPWPLLQHTSSNQGALGNATGRPSSVVRSWMSGACCQVNLLHRDVPECEPRARKHAHLFY